MELSLDTPLAGVIGPKVAAPFEKSFGITTVGELLGHYPRRYASRGELTPMRSLPIGDQVTIVAEVKQVSERQMKARKGTLLEVVIGDGHGLMTLTFFGQGWRKNELKVGRRGIFAGKVSKFNTTLQFAHPDYELFDDGVDGDGTSAIPTMDAVAAESWAHTPIPIYPATSTLTSWKIRQAVDFVLDHLGDVPDPLPREFGLAHHAIRAREAIVAIHRPRDHAEAAVAAKTLRLHEALMLQIALLQQRAEVRAMAATSRPAGSILERFDAALPYTLTPDQASVGAQIAGDLVGDWPMNRLVQGEVGSGKTLVALRAMLQVAQSGGQSALIAPTEVLAGQHLRSITKMLGPDLAAELMPTLLTGQMSAPVRRKSGLRVASGQARIVVGTHALLSEKTTFADLGLVVVDEQHRFGVEQRETLRAKGTHPHALVLTATPIPRTVAMTVFGDLDVSTIRTMPAGRAGIESFVAPIGEKPGWFGRVWDRAAEEVAKGRQVFVVAPAIDVDKAVTDETGTPAPPVEGEASGPRWGVVQVMEMLERHPAFRGLRVAMLHGKLPGDEKDALMRTFAAGDIDVLVATTVIEVGVDVPNASTMIVLDADRFGVSQLHQLRGRVGRGGVPGLCLLVTEALEGTPARTRVEAVAATLDGFALAEVDLQLRGEGDVLGDAQSGARSSLKLLRVIQDAHLIEAARGEAERLLTADPHLAAHPVLRAAVSRRVTQDDRAALGKS